MYSLLLIKPTVEGLFFYFIVLILTIFLFFAQQQLRHPICRCL